MTKTVSDLKKEYPIELSSGQTESLREVNNPRKGVEVLIADFDHPLAKGNVRGVPSEVLPKFNEKLAEALENNKPVNPVNIVAKQSLYDR